MTGVRILQNELLDKILRYSIDEKFYPLAVVGDMLLYQEGGAIEISNFDEHNEKSYVATWFPPLFLKTILFDAFSCLKKIL